MATPNGPYEQGFYANTEGDNENPYLFHTDEHNEWELGYADADIALDNGEF